MFADRHSAFEGQDKGVLMGLAFIAERGRELAHKANAVPPGLCFLKALRLRMRYIAKGTETARPACDLATWPAPLSRRNRRPVQANPPPHRRPGRGVVPQIAFASLMLRMARPTGWTKGHILPEVVGWHSSCLIALEFGKPTNAEVYCTKLEQGLGTSRDLERRA
jgi:hypothetical protein